jgi:hypothetical protein
MTEMTSLPYILASRKQSILQQVRVVILCPTWPSQMIDFSCKARTSVEEMKWCECQRGAVKSAPGEHPLILKK